MCLVLELMQISIVMKVRQRLALQLDGWNKEAIKNLLMLAQPTETISGVAKKSLVLKS